MQKFVKHILNIIEILYTGSISLIFRGFLSTYLMIIGFILILAFFTWFILSGLLHFFEPLKIKPRGQ